MKKLINNKVQSTKYKVQSIKYIVIVLCGLILNNQYSFAQNIGINASGATPNNSSIIDLNTGNTFTSPNGKGILPPNVALTSTTDAVTVTSPAISLLLVVKRPFFSVETLTADLEHFY